MMVVASRNSRAMAAKGKPFCKAQWSVQRFSAILKSAACEWFLIFLMLIDALLSYALTQFAHICNLQAPCILCSRLDHLLGNEKSNNFRNLLCTNHRLEISSLVSCHKHNKTRPCSCCGNRWKTRPNAQGLLALKSSLNAATKRNIPYSLHLNRRDSLKKRRDKIFGSVTSLQHPGKTGFNLLSHVGFNDLRFTSDSELEVRLSEEDDDKSLICEKSALKEDSVLRSITQIPLKPHCNNCDQVNPYVNFVDPRPSPLESYVQVDVQKPHGVKAFTCDATFHGLNELNWLSWPANPTANPSRWAELISLDDASSVASNVVGLSCANSMEKNELTDSLNQESTLSCCPQVIALHHDPQVEGKLMTSEETGTGKIGISSPNAHEDHSPSMSTKVEECPKIDEMVNESSSGKTNGGTDHSSDSESSESDKEHEVDSSKKQSMESSSGNTKDESDHNSDSESSESDKEHKASFASSQPSESTSGNTNDDLKHNSDSESSNNGKKHEVNFGSSQPLEKEADVVSNDMEQPPVISISVKECLKTEEMVYESTVKITNDDMDHNSSDSDKEQEVVNFTAEQALEKEIDAVTNDLKQPPVICTTIEECFKIDEVVRVFANGNPNDDMNHNSVSESFESDKELEVSTCTTIEECSKTGVVAYEFAINNINDDMDRVSESSKSDKEHEILNFSIGKSSEKETILDTNEFKQSPLISTTVEEFPKTDEFAYESAIKNVNNDMDNVSESTESDKEHESFGCSIAQSSENEVEVVANDMKQSPLISTTVAECSKNDEVADESAIKHSNDDMDNVSESTESDKGESLEQETNLVTDDLEQSLLINTTIEKSPTTNEAVYESAIENTNDDMDHGDIDGVVYDSTTMNINDDMDRSSVSESSMSDKQQVFNSATEKPSTMESNIVTNDMEQFSLQENPAELVNRPVSDDEGHNFSISYDDLQEDFSMRFNPFPMFHRSVSMESVESQDGSNVSDIEGESIVDRLKRQVEYDKKCIHSLYKELEEERSASEVAASQAMAMITRLQEEKAAMHMEALHYLRMMEEQAEYDVEALEKANELLNEKERDIQDLETELEYYRSNYMVNTIVETENEKSDGANEENTSAETESVEHHEYKGFYSFKSTMAESSKGSYRSFNNRNSSLEFEDEKVYIQLCLKSLEDKINKVFTNGLLARVPNSVDNGEEANPEQKGEESIDAERSQRNKEDNGPSKHIDQNSCNGTVTPEGESVDPDKNSHFSSDDVKVQISNANKRDEVDFLALEHKISDLTGKLETLQAGYDFLEHSLNSLWYGEEGLLFAENIVHQLQELCKLGIILDRRSGS